MTVQGLIYLLDDPSNRDCELFILRDGTTEKLVAKFVRSEDGESIILCTKEDYEAFNG